MKTLLALVAVLIMTTGLSACNTTAGLGQDIQNGGQKLENAADRHK